MVFDVKILRFMLLNLSIAKLRMPDLLFLNRLIYEQRRTISFCLVIFCAIANAVCLSGYAFLAEAFLDAYSTEVIEDQQKLCQSFDDFFYLVGLRCFFFLGLPIQIVSFLSAWSIFLNYDRRN